VKALQKQFPDYEVKTTGHSLGAALANLTAMSLIKDGIATSMTNFGSPRVGNVQYCSLADSKFPNKYRMTHFRDMVPHVPPHGYPLNYHHVSTEYYEDDLGSIKKCDGSG
jgi:predicted lipase